MAIDLTLKSVQLTARDATPPTLQNPGTGGVSNRRFVTGYLASVTASLSITSIIRLCEISAHAKAVHVRAFSGAQGAGAFDLGVFTKGGAVIDADFFLPAASFNAAAAVNGTADILTQYSLAERQLPLWEALGVSTEPAKGTMYEIGATVTTTDVTTGTGALGVEVEYSD